MKRALTRAQPQNPGTERLIERVDELRVLADPTRLRIFEALREAPASARGLARRFGLKPTALYRDFARLEKAGLIELAEECKRRGVTERLYQPAAERLRVDRKLAMGKQRSVETVLAAMSTILQVTAEDIQAAASDPSRPLADPQRMELGTLVVRTSPAKALQLMRHVRKLIELANACDGTGEQRVRLTLGLIPLTGAVDKEVHVGAER